MVRCNGCDLGHGLKSPPTHPLNIAILSFALGHRRHTVHTKYKDSVMTCALTVAVSYPSILVMERLGSELKLAC